MKAIIQLLSLAFLLCLSYQKSTAQDSQYSRVRIYMDGQSPQQFAQLGITCDHGNHRKGAYIENDLSVEEIALLKSGGYRYEVLIKDVVQHYQDQNNDNSRSTAASNNCATSAAPNIPTPSNFSLGSMGGFLTYQQLLNELDSMASKYPNLISPRAAIDSSNLTHNNNYIYWVRISDNPTIDEAEPEAMYNALHHSREPLSLSQLVFYMWYLLENYATDPEIQYLLDNTELYFVPCINPDGYLYNESIKPNGGGMWRKNRKDNGSNIYGVDLNRNYGYQWAFNNQGSSNNPSSDTYRGPSAFSEPETQNIRDFCNAHQFQISLNYHAYGNMLIYPWAYNDQHTPDSTTFREFAQLMASENGYIHGTGTETVGYTSNGDADDWIYGEQVSKNKILSITPEAGDDQYGFWPPSNQIVNLSKATLLPNLNVPRYLLNYGTVTETTPAILTQLNNQIYYDTKRYGFTAGSLTVSLTPLSSNIVSVGANHIYNLNQFQETSDSIQLVLSPSINNGDLVEFLIGINNGYVTTYDTIQKVYGAYAVALQDSANSLQNWVNIGTQSNWDITTNDYYSAPSSITDSKTGNYGNNQSSEIIITQSLDLSTAVDARLSFWAKWDIEPDYDYVQVMAAGNSGTFQALCGKFTNEGTNYQDLGQPLFDGTQGTWVQEDMSLNDFLGEPAVVLKIRLKSDQWLNGDGFYFDDLKVNVLNSIISDTNAPRLEQYRIGQNQPNPAQQQVYIPLGFAGIQQQDLQLQVTNILGRKIASLPIQNKASGISINIKDWDNGVYFYQVVGKGFQSEVKRMMIEK
ncbi:MAG: T9SS type A sorting domain-containing protein [Aureispira sp.]|nr:T9SS type A sorting domain-containing protein [Aureispira sp.]